MTFLFQPNAHDTRLIREFNRHIGEIRQHLSIDPNVSAHDCQRMIMSYLKLVSRYKMVYHSQYAVLSSYTDWIYGNRDLFIQSADEAMRRSLKKQQLDFNRVPTQDNQLEYDASQSILVPSIPLLRERPETVPDQVLDIPGANVQDIHLFYSNRAHFYQRYSTDLDLLTSILHRRYYCCRLINEATRNHFVYMMALERRDNMAALLKWIVCVYDLILTIYDAQRPLCMARYDDYPYEGLLARIYNLRLLQSGAHPTIADSVLSGYRNYPCCMHCHRSTYSDDKIFAKQFYQGAPIDNLYRAGDGYLVTYAIDQMPFTSAQYDVLSQSIVDYQGSMRRLVREVVANASSNSENQYYRYYLQQFASVILKLQWLKNQDHTRERVWQNLLSYMVYVFFTLVYYPPTESERYSFPQIEECDPLYVPSAAVRDNDSVLNPLQLRRFTILVCRQINTGNVSYCPITEHLFGPNYITASIGNTI